MAYAETIRRVRIAAAIEGVSYLALLGVAMPLKYMAGLPLAVRLVGWAHGALFVLLALLTLHALARRALPFTEACLVGVASLLPFGPFVIDGRLKRREQTLRAE